MCNLYYNEATIAVIERMLGDLVDVLEEARCRPHKNDQRPTDEVLVIFQRQRRLAVGTAVWGFPKLTGKGHGPVLNARSESLVTSPMWLSCTRCWMPATGWIEYVEEGEKNIPHLLATPDGAPMLLAGMCGVRDGSRRVAMVMQDAPKRLAYVGERLPLPYAFDAIALTEPDQIMDQVTARQM